MGMYALCANVCKNIASNVAKQPRSSCAFSSELVAARFLI
jgi:hypothetical protein